MNFWENITSLLEEYIIKESIWRIAGAVVTIIFTLLFRKILVKVIIGLVRKLTQKTKNVMDDKLLEALEKPARFVFVVIGFYIAGQIIKFSTDFELFIDRITRSLILFSLFWGAYRASGTLTVLFKKLTEKTETKLDDMLVSFLSNGLKVIIVILGGITVTQVWFDEIAGILTGLGLGGLAFALAAKDTASNLFGSINIMIDRPFTIGDWVETPHVEGTVEEMGFRSTRIRTFAQALVTIPNSTMSNDPITNWSRMGKRRISYRLGLTYNTTSEQMKECLKRLRGLLENHPEVHQQTVFVYFERFGDSSLDLFLYFFTKTTNWQKFLEVQEDINLKIVDILDNIGVSVAYPSRSIYIEDCAKKQNI